MPTGTLCISKKPSQPDTYEATFVAYDATPPCTFTKHGAEELRAFLESVGLSDAERDRAAREARSLNLAVLMNVELRVPVARTLAAA